MDSGFITRPIGRLRMESSPVNTVLNVCPARIPEIRRMVVPELPTSMTLSGSARPCSPLPCTTIFSSVTSMAMPILRKAPTVLRQSSPYKKPVISVSPSARDPNIIERCEMDLSPGMVKVPFSPRLGSMRCFMVVSLPKNLIRVRKCYLLT